MKEGYNFKTISKKEDLTETLEKGLLQLYQAVFAEPPYEEAFTEAEVKSFFELYVLRGLLIVAENQDEVIAFAAAIPLILEEAVAELAEKANFDLEKSWYYADLGVKKDQRRQGLATQLGKTLMDSIPAETVLMRTSENNLASQKVNQNIGFELVEGMEQQVLQTRQNGEEIKDRRIFLELKK